MAHLFPSYLFVDEAREAFIEKSSFIKSRKSARGALRRLAKCTHKHFSREVGGEQSGTVFCFFWGGGDLRLLVKKELVRVQK